MEWELELGGAQSAAIALAFSCAALLLVIFLWNRGHRRNSSADRSAETAEMHAALLRLEGELPQLLRNMNSRLDAKMQALRQLIDEAGGTIEQLRRIKRQVTADPELARTVPLAVEPGMPASLELLDLNVSAPAPVAPAAERSHVEPVATDAADLRSQRYAHVYALADGGLDSAEISGETGMHRGEVELVLNLRRKRVRVDRGGRSEPAHAIRSPEEAPA